jgi:NAD(P)-dependent dehydrogenase (short-subunit alcohol dehydrogenase family)
MSKHRVLSFKPYLRLEWRGQDGQSETEQPDHSASLGDSITSSTRIRFSVHTIINVSSAAAYLASPMGTMYAATKGAISTLTRTVAWDLGNRQITVNAVAPGFTDTDMSNWLADPAAKAWAASQSSLGRVTDPRDIVDIIAFLASDDARWVNGQVIDATGGGVLGVARAA